MRITRTSPFSGMTTQRDLKITAEQLANWLMGTLIQRVWPLLPRGDREFIMTGITEQEWDTNTAWGVAEYALRETEDIILLLDPDEVEEVLQLIAKYNPVKPIRYLPMWELV